MKFSTIIATTFAILAPTVYGKYQVHASYTDTLVDVGDLDIFWSVWNRMYDVSDSRGGLSDISRRQFTGDCVRASQSQQLNTRVILDGQWGAVNGVNGWQMRDALIKSMWRTIEVLGHQQSYPIYTQCSGFAWQEAKPNSRHAACGGQYAKSCPRNRRCPYGLECQRFAWGHRLPSMVRINIYNPNGSLRADSYQARISSERSVANTGCGRVGSIIEILTGFIPGVGRYFEKGIKVACRRRSTL
ncbi:hypothetical protein ACN47E_008252 [Coniothyrium glycines]